MTFDIGFYLVFIIVYYMVVVFGFWVADKLDHQSLRLIMAATMVLIAFSPAIFMIFFGVTLPDLSLLLLPAAN